MTPPATATAEPRLARIASLLADASRARMLSHLLGGEYASAGELARAAGVGAATASGHLARLLDGGLLVCEPRGRHRYYRLADAEVAHALEALALVAERGSHESDWARPMRARLRYARCCYGHLAGQLGVGLLRGLVQTACLQPLPEGRYRLSDTGAQALSSLGLDGPGWQRRSASPGRRVAYGCMDWSERRDHLAGPLASALLSRCLDQGWLRRPDGDRALALTPPGQQALGPWLQVAPAA